VIVETLATLFRVPSRPLCNFLVFMLDQLVQNPLQLSAAAATHAATAAAAFQRLGCWTALPLDDEKQEQGEQAGGPAYQDHAQSRQQQQQPAYYYYNMVGAYLACAKSVDAVVACNYFPAGRTAKRSYVAARATGDDVQSCGFPAPYQPFAWCLFCSVCAVQATRSMLWELPAAARPLMSAALQTTQQDSAAAAAAAARVDPAGAASTLHIAASEVYGEDQLEDDCKDEYEEEYEDEYEDGDDEEVVADDKDETVSSMHEGLGLNAAGAAGLSSRAARRALLALAGDRVMPSKSCIQSGG
jgi:hypothetical protein